VDRRDVDLQFFILVKLTIMPNSSHPSREATCGIMVLNLAGLTGTQASGASLFLSLSGIAVGLGLWRRTGLQTDRSRIVPVLGMVVLLALLAVSFGWWGLAIACTVIVVLLLVISLRLAFA
jgi:hypothetical protein